MEIDVFDTVYDPENKYNSGSGMLVLEKREEEPCLRVEVMQNGKMVQIWIHSTEVKVLRKAEGGFFV